MSHPEQPYNPLELGNLAVSVAEALLLREAQPLSSRQLFSGAGIYAIYYQGDLPWYRLLARANEEGCREPIYVGKAIPSGARKGQLATSSNSLFGRLSEHRASIESASNLDLADFRFRSLIVESVWIPLGESLLISRFAPVWNSIVDGFGNHDPGKGRHAGRMPRWDVLHPGRPWATRLAGRSESAEAIARDVEEYLRARLT